MPNHAAGAFNGERLYVVMPIYNEQASIAAVVREWKACLETVAPDHRILILNDGSNDNTAEVLAGIAASTPGIEVINKPNSGHGRTCVSGYGEAIARAHVGFRSIPMVNATQYSCGLGERAEHAAILATAGPDDGLASKVI